MTGWGNLFKKDSPTVKELVANLQKEETVQPLKLGDTIRISSLPYLCPRQEVLASILNIERKEIKEAESRKRMGLGTEWHRTLQNHLFGPAKMLEGQWKCEGCGQVMGSLVSMRTKPDECSKCGSKSTRYWETTLLDPDLPLKGHCDGFFESKLYEFKTTNSYRFKSVSVKPDPKNVGQGMVYMDVVRRLGIKVDVLELIYVDVGAAKLVDAMASHLIPFDKDMALVQRAKVTLTMNGIRDKRLPPKTCETRECYEAKGCPLIDLCWTNGDAVDVG